LKAVIAVSLVLVTATFSILSFAQTDLSLEVTVPQSTADIERELASEIILEEGAEILSDEKVDSSLIDEDTPVTHDQIAGEIKLTDSRAWRAPNYANQNGALGWTSETFSVPKGLEKNYKFWLDIYSKYNTDQGVIHDAENIDLVYSQIDFTPISVRTDIGKWQKEALKIRRVKQAKMRAIEMLKKFEKLKDPSNLNPEEKRIWDYFAANIPGKKKFKLAQGKNRIRFQLGQKDRVIQGIFFSGRYLEDFEKVFRDEGLPIELTRMVFVESSFNVLARSKVGASGLWQIMPATAKPFFPKSDAVDMRNHPQEATKIAAKFLRGNYKMLKAWPLAITGYNHGPTGILKLTKKFKTKDIGELVANKKTNKNFGFASRNFYASFLAVLEVERKAAEYLGPVNWSQPLDAVSLKTGKPLKYHQILGWFDGDDLKAQVYNPHISSAARKKGQAIPKWAVISIPRTREAQVRRELADPTGLKQAENQE
jgi:membrane-bound lytic murein transglycosylase D